MTVRRALPSLVTLLGLVLGLAAVWCMSPTLALVSLGLDVADGELARRLGVSSRAGGLFDFWSDIAIGNALALRLVLGGELHAGMVSVVLMSVCPAITAMWGGYGVKTSGRAVATFLACMVWR